MKCPHCLVEIHPKTDVYLLGEDVDGKWGIVKINCPSCSRFIFKLIEGELRQAPSYVHVEQVNQEYLVRPKGSSRPPCPPEVPSTLTEDYTEACLVLPDSSKASAALSRRCLQNILREIAKVKHDNLANEIQEVLDRNNLPSHITESLDAIRNIGNFAAHPIKSNSSGEIVPVETGEAEWNLDVLEALFDYYFVQPSIITKKKEALNKKLQDAGKKEMK